MCVLSAMVGILQNGTLAASLSPSAVSGTSPYAGIVTANVVTATPSGGKGPYSYSWSLVSGDATVLPNFTTTASVYFFKYFTGVGLANALYRCQITDILGHTAYTGNVAITLEYTGYV